AAGAGSAPVEPVLDLGFGQRQSRGAAVHHAAERGPVALAPGGHAVEVAEGVVRHVAPLLAARPCRNKSWARIVGRSGSPARGEAAQQRLAEALAYGQADDQVAGRARAAGGQALTLEADHPALAHGLADEEAPPA